MRRFDFEPLYRSTVGFDRLATVLDRALSSDVATGGYPPYNIEKHGDDAYRITIAVAGFADSELNVETRDHQLVITAKKASEEKADAKTYLHRGIATRAFEKRFQLADHVRAVAAETTDGLLHIDLVREIPDSMKPRRIEIAGPSTIEVANTEKAGDAVV